MASWLPDATCKLTLAQYQSAHSCYLSSLLPSASSTLIVHSCLSLSPRNHLYTRNMISCCVSPCIFHSSPVTPFLLLHFSPAQILLVCLTADAGHEWHLGLCVSVGACVCVKNVGDSQVMDNRIPFLFPPHSWEIPSNEGQVGHTLWGWPELLLVDG